MPHFLCISQLTVKHLKTVSCICLTLSPNTWYSQCKNQVTEKIMSGGDLLINTMLLHLTHLGDSLHRHVTANF